MNLKTKFNCSKLQFLNQTFFRGITHYKLITPHVNNMKRRQYQNYLYFTISFKPPPNLEENS